MRQQEKPIPPPAPVQKEGAVSLVGVASMDNELVQQLQRENQALKDELAKMRIEVTQKDNEISRLNVTIATLEENTKTMVEMLKNKNNQVSDSKKLVSEMSKVNVNYSDEGLAVRAQMEEIRQFAIRSQQAARTHSASVASQQQQQQSVLDREIAQQQMILQQRMIEQQISQEGKASPVPRQQSSPIPVAAAVHGKALPRVDSTIPKELHPIHYPDPQRVGPWQSTTSYTKTKRGTTKAIVTWTLVDSRENRHVLTLEHNHYYWSGKSKRKVNIDNVVRMSEKSGNSSYRFHLPAGDDVTVLINSSANGFEYELMVNDLTFLESKRFYTVICQLSSKILFLRTFTTP
jgi:myosin heavy subunit